MWAFLPEWGNSKMKFSVVPRIRHETTFITTLINIIEGL
jgi:hypothetical protein